MECPKCGKTLVRSRTMRDTATPASCSGCGGFWLPADVATRVIGSPAALVETKVGASDAMDRRTGRCPEGHGILLRARVDLDPAFYLERCSACGGIWFDRGEWNQLASSDLLASLLEFWTPSWRHRRVLASEERQREHGEKLASDSHEERKLGELVASLDSLAAKIPDRETALTLLDRFHDLLAKRFHVS